MGADEIVLWSILCALALAGLAVIALIALWLPAIVDILLHRDDEE